jgi:hypothetical protein
MSDPFDPFDSLDETDWSLIDCALGPATDLPGYLRQLMSEDRDARNEAVEEVGCRIMSDGDVFEATAYVVPFLACAALHTGDYRAEYVDWMVSLCRPVPPADGRWDDDRLRVHGAIAEQLPRLIEFVHDPDVRVRRAMMLFLVCCPAADVAAAIDLQAASDESPLVRADQLIALAFLQPHWPGLQEHLAAALSDPAPVVRYEAARILVGVAGTSAPERTIGVLADSIAEIGVPLAQFSQMNALIGPPEPAREGEIGAVFARLGEPGNCLVQFPDLAFQAADRIVAAQTEHSGFGVELAGQVVGVWRDREAQEAQVVAARLAAVPEVRGQHALLRRLARSAERIADPAPLLGTTALEWAQASAGLVSGAAIAVLARLGDPSALQRAEQASDQWMSWQPWVLAELCEVAGERAAFLVPVVRKWLAAYAARGDGRGDAKSVLKAVRHLGPAGYETVPDLVSLIERDLYISDVCRELRRMGAAGASASQSLEALAGRGNQTVRIAAAAAHFAITGHDMLARQVVGITLTENKLDRWSIEPLGSLGPAAAESVPLLEGQLDHPSAFSRVDAALALWRITGDIDRSVPVLADEIGASPVVLEAVDALLEIGIRPDNCVEALHSLANSPYRQVDSARVDPPRRDDDLLRDHALLLIGASSYQS